jgi:hypothetical protein
MTKGMKLSRLGRTHWGLKIITGTKGQASSCQKLQCKGRQDIATVHGELKSAWIAQSLYYVFEGHPRLFKFVCHLPLPICFTQPPELHVQLDYRTRSQSLKSSHGNQDASLNDGFSIASALPSCTLSNPSALQAIAPHVLRSWLLISNVLLPVSSLTFSPDRISGHAIGRNTSRLTISGYASADMESRGIT